MASPQNDAPGSENLTPVSGGVGVSSAGGTSGGGPELSDSAGASGAGTRRVTPTEIARDWGTSRAYASKCIAKKGCPTDSLEAARKWRLENSKYGVGYRSKGAAKNVSSPVVGVEGPARPVVASAVNEGSPIDAHAAGSGIGGSKVFENECAGAARGGAGVRSGDARCGTVRDDDVGQKVGVRDLSSIEASLGAAVEVEQEALRLVLEAQRARTDTILSVRIAAYSKAQSNRLEAEERVQKFLTTERVLVPMTEAKAVARRGYDVLLPQLRALAKSAGPLCNPENALRATQILERQIEAIIAAAEKEYGEGGKAEGGHVGGDVSHGVEAPRENPRDIGGPSTAAVLPSFAQDDMGGGR